jgi:hypothetical protein
MEVEEVLTADKKVKFQLKDNPEFYTILEPIDNKEEKFNLLIYYKYTLQWRNIVTSYQDGLNKSTELLTKLYFHNKNKRPILKESPDGVKIDKRKIMWFENQAYGFNYDPLGNLMVTPPGRSHYDSFKLGREQMFNSGRLWLNDKIISFWEYPTQNRMNTIIKDLEKYFKIIIDKNEWMIEIVTDEYGKLVIKPYSGKMWEEEVTKIIPLKNYENLQISSGTIKRTTDRLLPVQDSIITNFSHFKMKY